VIEDDREFEHFSELLESLDRLARELTPEEKALDVLLARLIADYDEKIDLPELPAHETIAFLRHISGDWRSFSMCPRRHTSELARDRCAVRDPRGCSQRPNPGRLEGPIYHVKTKYWARSGFR
jgi:hypothetical protein